MIELYFNVTLSRKEIDGANTRTHLLFLQHLDIADKLVNAQEEDKDRLYGQYNQSIFDLCTQYGTMYDMLDKDMNLVKRELQNSFQKT